MGGQANSSGGHVSVSGANAGSESAKIRDAYDTQQHQNGR
jgi:hypothetical protein